jgi:isoleucyl-tRNA synthetase
MTPEILEHVEHLFREKGSDCWWELDIKDLMPPGALRDAADDYTKGTDTMDVWFDSGESYIYICVYIYWNVYIYIT